LEHFAMQHFIAYFRVSTQKQGVSGLGLEAQQEAVARHILAHGGQLVHGYQEIESGKRKDRPELLKALSHARRSKATLLVAKLDRLGRNVAFLSALMEAGVDFVACDNPHANRLMLHMMVAFAEEEARQISIRTKAALQAYKARGGKLGAQDPRCKSITSLRSARESGQRLGTVANSQKSRSAYEDIIPVMQSFRSQGATLRQIAEQLNALKQTTRTGKPWNQVQVMRVLDRTT
jgi:DNA invertase Pin-like site-specific DNA recombinase